MTQTYFDRVKATTSTTGTGTISLGSAVAQFQSFGSKLTNGNTCDYLILSGDNASWEVGNGTYSSTGPTLSRDVVYDGSSGPGAKISLTGTSEVMIPFSASRAPTMPAGAQFNITDVPRGYTLTKQGSVISPGGAGSWNQSLVESPSVFFDPTLGKYRMLFVGYTGTVGSPSIASIGEAESTDLITWTLNAGNPIFQASGSGPDSTGVTGPFVWYEYGTYYLFYIGLTATGYEGGTPSLCLATSTDFSTWTRHGAVVSPTSGWRSTAVYHGNVVKRGNEYLLFFNAFNGTVEQIGYARSYDLLNWTVDDVNSPILTVGTAGAWDANKVGDPYVYRRDDMWFMAYYGYNGTNAQDGFAFTTDEKFPLGWTKFSGNPVLTHGTTGAIDATDAHKPAIWETATRHYHWYTAVDGSSPANRQIALATDENLLLGSLSSLTNGQLLIGSTGSAPTKAALSAGTNVTITNGAGTITIAASGSGGSGALNLISTQIASNSASLQWTGLTTYENYLLILENLLAGTSGQLLLLQLGEGGTPTWQTTGYYLAQFSNQLSLNGTFTGSNYSADAGFRLDGGLSTAAPGHSGHVNLYALLSATNHLMDFWAVTGDGTNFYQGFGSGAYHADTIAITAVRLIMGSGNIASGKASLYGFTT